MAHWQHSWFGSAVLLAGTVAAQQVSTPNMATAEAAETLVTLDIPSQAIGDALNEFGKQTGLHVVLYSTLGEGIVSPQISGTYTAKQALEKLLSHTSLRFEYLDKTTVAVLQASSPGADVASKAELSDFWNRFLLAQTNSSSASTHPSDEEAKTGQSANDVRRDLEKLEEIIVTAQRRTENLQDVPISISVLGGEELDSSSFSGVTDALRTLPGVGYDADQYTGGAVLSVRGVSNASGRYQGAGPVGYYIDGVPYGFIRNAIYPSNPGAYDLNRVEFLAGPQGTLYGANSLNGVVRVLTNDANVDEFEFKARTSVSTTEGGDESYRGDATINLPIAPGQFALRASIGQAEDGGWIDSPTGEDLNSTTSTNYRLRARAEPTDTFSVGLVYWHTEAEMGLASVSDDDGNITALQPQPSEFAFDTLALEVVKEFRGATLTSTTSHLDYDTFGVVSGEPVGAPFTINTDFVSEIVAQEVNLVSSSAGPFRWSVGAFYRDAQEITNTDFVLFDGTNLVEFENYRDKSESYAVYGELGYDLTEHLALAVGLRYFHDDQTLTTLQNYSPSVPAGSRFDASSQATTPRVVLTWEPSDTASFYASYSEGFRSGFAQTPQTQVLYPSFTPAEPDHLSNYEIGAKGSLWAGRLRYETALYYIDWQNAQVGLSVVFQDNPRVVGNAVVNSTALSGPGASFAITFEPIDDLIFRAGADWNNLTYDDDLTDADNNVLADGGSRAGFSPELTLLAGVEYGFPLSGDWTGTVALDANYMSPLYMTEFNGGSYETDSRFSSSARFVIDSNDHLRFSLFADNITNEYPKIISTGIPEWQSRPRPRTIGVQLDYHY